MSTSATAPVIKRFDQSVADLIGLLAQAREEMTRMDPRLNAWNAANRQPRAYRCVDKLITQTADTLAILGELGISADYDDCRHKFEADMRARWEREYRSAWEETEQDGEAEKEEFRCRDLQAAE